MAEQEFTATKILLKTEKDGTKKYYIPYVPNATSTETGLVKPDGTTTEVSSEGAISVKDGVYAKASDVPAAVTESTVSGWGFTKNAGTVTQVKINGTAKSPTSGVVDLGTVLTTHQSLDSCVKTSGNQTIAGTKTFSETIAGSITGNAATATKATSDGSGNNIVDTYSTKTELENALSTLTTQLNNAAE